MDRACATVATCTLGELADDDDEETDGLRGEGSTFGVMLCAKRPVQTKLVLLIRWNNQPP
jgi:hypothetical protein